MATTSNLTCPERAAHWPDGLDCNTMLAELTAWEWDDLELGALHFLAVATFNLQHPSRFSEAAIERLKWVFDQNFDNGLPVSRIRDIHARVFDGSETVLNPDERPAVQPREWAMTIADVHVGGPSGAADRVMTWVRSVRVDL